MNQKEYIFNVTSTIVYISVKTFRDILQRGSDPIMHPATV